MEFVSNIKDILQVVGEVEALPNGRGIQMGLPEEYVPEEAETVISRIVYAFTKSGLRYIETVSAKDGNWPVYGEASIPEILAFAEKAQQDLPDSPHTKSLVKFAEGIKASFENL